MTTPAPPVTDHTDFELRKREKAHTRAFGDVFEGRDELIVYSHMFYDGQPREWQCEGCTRNPGVTG